MSEDEEFEGLGEVGGVEVVLTLVERGHRFVSSLIDSIRSIDTWTFTIQAPKLH